ncbi:MULTISPECIES: hypothetical protein [Streptomyces]|uniref:Uncharacterized protein n=1 Tax=Streptomyces pseudovenezuelae TaxID=67350 RepID=A0A101N096_9ACTN|nr:MULTISPECIES: hypothetical protein [Streptomyces]KUM84103.1 hypothetical protein AQI94_32695 [Streptomyces pseudovenezuelae]
MAEDRGQNKTCRLTAPLAHEGGSLMLSAAAFIDHEKRNGAGHGRIDHVAPKSDGSHLLEL